MFGVKVAAPLVFLLGGCGLLLPGWSGFVRGARAGAAAQGAAVYLDRFGGVICEPMERRGYFYTARPGSRWMLVTPDGNPFWMRAVFNVTAGPAAAAKYGDANVTWGPQQIRRLRSWGFNATAEYSSRYAQPTASHPSWPNGRHPEPMPFTALIWPSYYSLTNAGNYAPGPVKELVRATNDTAYRGWRAYSPDIWDPNFKIWLTNFMRNDFSVREWLNGPNKEYLIGLNVDDTDWLQGFGAGPDFKTVANGEASGGREQPHLGWIVLITPPSQYGSARFAPQYDDTTVYTKLEFSRFLAARYGSIDALNAAWNSTYSTFGSDGGWGSGSGLLDEDGVHPWIPRDFKQLGDASPAIRNDLDDFLLHHARKYFSDIRGVLREVARGRLYLGPTTLGGWGSPPRRQILEAAGQFVDVLMLPTIPAGVPDDDARVAFVALHGGDRPWASWEGMMANPDSGFHASPTPDTVTPNSSSQQARAQVFARRIEILHRTQTPAGIFPVIGFKFWEHGDNNGEAANWGLVSRRDNAYDGREARTAAGTDAWGYPTGGEDRDFGDFLSVVRQKNFDADRRLLAPAPAVPRRSGGAAGEWQSGRSR